MNAKGFRQPSAIEMVPTMLKEALNTLRIPKGIAEIKRAPKKLFDNLRDPKML